MLPANKLQTLAAAPGLGFADPNTSFDIPTAAHQHTSTDLSPSFSQGSSSNVLPIVPVAQNWNSTQPDNLFDKLGLSALAPSKAPSNVITVTPTLPTATSGIPTEADSAIAGLTWEQISQAAEYLKNKKPAATRSTSVFSPEDSGSNDVFSDASEYQTPDVQTSDGSIERNLIPKPLFARDTDQSSMNISSEAVEGIRKGRDKVKSMGHVARSGAADLVSHMGLDAETSPPASSPATSAGSAIKSLTIDPPRQPVRDAFQQVSHAASETASNVEQNVPNQVTQWQDKISDVSSDMGDLARGSARSAMTRANSVVDNAAADLDKNIVRPVRGQVIEPVFDTATRITNDVQSRIPGPNSAADAISTAVNEFTQQVKDQAQSTVADTSRAIDGGVEALQQAADKAKSSVRSTIDSLPSPSEVARETVTSPPVTHVPSQSVFDSWSSDDRPVTQAVQAAREAASTVGDRFKGGLHNFGIDLGRMRQQTSAVARSGYDNTATALQSKYHDTANTVGRWYNGAADTASNWTSRVGQAFREAVPTIDSETSESPTPVISAPLSVQTTVDPFAEFRIIDAKGLDSHSLAASIPTHRTDLINGGWLRSLIPRWGSSKVPTESVADSALPTGGSSGVPVAPTTATLSEPTPSSAPTNRNGWFNFSKKSAPASVTPASVPSASRPSGPPQYTRSNSSVTSRYGKYGRGPTVTEKLFGLGPGRETDFWRKVDGRTGTASSSKSWW